MFNGTIQVVLQKFSPSGLVCRCFGGTSSVNPALIAVLPAGGPHAEQLAIQAGDAIERALQTSVLGAQIARAPCDPHSHGPIQCQASSEPNCRRILVLIFDGTPSFPDRHSAIQFWAKKLNVDPHFYVIPCFPRSAQSQAGSLTPAPFKRVNAFFWVRDPAEVALPVLAAAGVGEEDHRLFISYRRGEGQALAEQLFDELNRMNFDVFLDQFRIRPGWDFQERLTEELAHKSMILVLETANIMRSQWITHEVTYAVRNRLGILAIQPFGGTSRPEIANRRRLLIAQNGLNQDGTLRKAWLDQACGRIRLVHQVAILRKRHQMQQAMRNSLLYEQIYAVRTTPGGFLEVRPGTNAAGINQLLLTPRPAELVTFQMAHGRADAAVPKKPAVIAPAALLVGRRQTDMQWLASLIGLHFRDESEIPSIAREIKMGGL